MKILQIIWELTHIIRPFSNRYKGVGMSTIDELQRVLDKHFGNANYRELYRLNTTELRYFLGRIDEDYVVIQVANQHDRCEIILKTFTDAEKLDTFLTLLFN